MESVTLDKTWTSVVTILFLIPTCTASIKTYNLDDKFCTLNLVRYVLDLDAGTHIARLEYDGRFDSERRRCLETIQPWRGDTDDKFMFRFDSLHFPTRFPGNCSGSYVQVFDGESADSHIVTGLAEQVCGTSPPNGTFVGRHNRLTFGLVSDEDPDEGNRPDNSFVVTLWAYRTGVCTADEYKCSNGRCIYDDVNCNGLNPCGDGSDCQWMLTPPTIAAIVFGTVLAISLLCCVVRFFVKRRCRRTDGRSSQSDISNEPHGLDNPVAMPPDIMHVQMLAPPPYTPREKPPPYTELGS